MFEGFEQKRVEGVGATINLRVGGSGPPLLLLHGNPLTHVMWHKVAPRLAERFTVVATDLRGYGDSSKPPGGDDHSGYSFRAMANDQVEVMRRLGFERWLVAGHDRGGRAAHRMALDHPQRVAKVAFLDIVPTHHMLNNIKRGWAVDSYHWFFMAQPYDYPEQMLASYGLERYIRKKLDKKGVGLGGFTPEALAEYIRCCTPENIHAVCEDYRAAVSIDMAHDQLEVMTALGFDEFFVCGHDRGARVAHRMALDHGDRVRKVAFLDIVPTHHALTHIRREWAVDAYHWFFMAQPYDYPEQMLIAYGLERYIRKKLDKKGVGMGAFTPEALAEYIRCCTPENIHAVCEDYRAALGIDFAHDEADLHRKLTMPALVLWGELSHVQRSFKPIEAWRERASNVRGRMLPCGHYPAEQAPDETYDELRRFFAE